MGYGRLIEDNLRKAFAENSNRGVAKKLGGEEGDSGVGLWAFGKRYLISPGALSADGTSADDPEAVVVSLYAACADVDPLIEEPFKSFKDLPNSMPYHGAFAANVERILVPYVERFKGRSEQIALKFRGRVEERGASGDFSILLYPLPKVCLRYVFYLPDEEFSASAICLFSCNVLSFLPLDGAADTAEYTSRAIIRLCSS